MIKWYFLLVCLQVCIIVFLFAKRQITRFALKSRGPHVSIGADAPRVGGLHGIGWQMHQG